MSVTQDSICIYSIADLCLVNRRGGVTKVGNARLWVVAIVTRWGDVLACVCIFTYLHIEPSSLMRPAKLATSFLLSPWALTHIRISTTWGLFIARSRLRASVRRFGSIGGLYGAMRSITRSRRDALKGRLRQIQSVQWRIGG